MKLYSLYICNVFFLKKEKFQHFYFNYFFKLKRSENFRDFSKN